MTNTPKQSGGITAPMGYLAAGVSADISRKGADQLDLAIILSREPASAAGVFTTNLVQAAPVVLTRQRVRRGFLRAIVVNSGNANACTGSDGLDAANEMARLTARKLDIQADEVAVASTGVIGLRLPMERVTRGIELAAADLSPNGHEAAARAIMTTDTRPKEAQTRLELPSGGTCILGGMAKGSGMIHPNMATMLAFVTTDASIEPSLLQKTLHLSCEKSFNMISVDGDTSTNDMVLMLANSMAGQPPIEDESPDWEAFAAGLDGLLIELAKAIVKDGEGATKLMEITVNGAATLEEARRLARSISSSSLVKTALFGQDANWGRILCAMGYAGAFFDPAKVDLMLGPIPVMLEGAGLDFDERAASELLKRDEISIRAELHQGSASAVAWGCDLSHEYVSINSDYRS